MNCSLTYGWLGLHLKDSLLTFARLIGEEDYTTSNHMDGLTGSNQNTIVWIVKCYKQ